MRVEEVVGARLLRVLEVVLRLVGEALAQQPPEGAPEGARVLERVLRGHQDGVIAAGENLAQCVLALRQLLKRARELN